MKQVYKNSTEVAQLGGHPIYMADIVDACLRGRLNLFLQGDTGSGKTQLAKDAMNDFGYTVGNGDFAQKVLSKYANQLDVKGTEALEATKQFAADRTMFVLGRNDMDIRSLFQQINLGRLFQKPKYNLEPLVNPKTGEIEYYYPKVNSKGIFTYKKLSKDQAELVKGKLKKMAGSTEDIKELTSRINTNLFVVDELPNCVPAVRAQLFNLFDGFVEIDGRHYPIGGDYSVGIATGNIGQQFTESSNELGRALKDRMHVIIDVDYFHPTSSDTLEILAENTNPRVEFTKGEENRAEDIIIGHKDLCSREIPLSKLVVANYLIHGLDYCSKGSKRKMKGAWPTQLEAHEQGSDVGLVLPVSVRAAKSIIRLSQALDDVLRKKGVSEEEIEQGHFESMMTAYKLVSTYSGVLNEAAVQNVYYGNHYDAMAAVVETTRAQFKGKDDAISAGFEMAREGKKNKKVLDLFNGRWAFIEKTLEGLLTNKK